MPLIQVSRSTRIKVAESVIVENVAIAVPNRQYSTQTMNPYESPKDDQDRQNSRDEELASLVSEVKLLLVQVFIAILILSLVFGPMIFG